MKPWKVDTSIFTDVPNCISKHDGEYLCGTNRYGEKVEYPMDTWLCGMCDKPLVNSECAACEISYVDIEVGPTHDELLVCCFRSRWSRSSAAHLPTISTQGSQAA